MTVGFAFCGSFCTFAQVFPVMEKLAEKHKLIPIFSPVVCSVNSRFGTAASHMQRATEICGTKPLSTTESVLRGNAPGENSMVKPLCRCSMASSVKKSACATVKVRRQSVG